jgi:hypothetical protein
MSAARAAYREGAAEQDRRHGRKPKRPAAAPDRGERPLPPWGSFPLTEIVIGVGAVAAVVGLVIGPARGLPITAGGVVACLMAVLEFTLRDHLSGYKSHSLVLALLIMVAVHSVLFFTLEWMGPLAFAADLVLFVVLAVVLKQLFDARSRSQSRGRRRTQA